MSLTLNEEQQLLKDTAREFVQKNAPISHFRELRDSNDDKCYSQDLWKKMADLGWAGILIDEEYGGSNFGMVGLGAVLEETGRNLVPSPLISTALLGASLIQLAGNENQKKDLLPKISEGKLTTALALDEGTRHDPLNISTFCVKKEKNLVLEGRKTFVVDGQSANLLIVVARNSEPNNKEESDVSRSMYLVDPKQAGVKITKISMVDSRSYCEIIFDKVKVNEEDRLGEKNVVGIIDDVLERVQIGISAEMLGNALEAFDQTIQYLKDRKQFGKPIGSFQALQHRAAHMFSELELTKSSVQGALNAIDENSNDKSRYASLAKFKAGETLNLVSNEAVQMHGGVGVTDEFDIGFFLKRARVAEQMFGSSDYHLDRYAVLSEY